MENLVTKVTRACSDISLTKCDDAQASPTLPHDLRRTCARLCHMAGGELDQIQFLLGDVSIQTTERYLGCKQRLRVAVNDRMGIEPDAA
jgi:integrase